jgi:hypothetical protein
LQHCRQLLISHWGCRRCGEIVSSRLLAIHALQQRQVRHVGRYPHVQLEQQVLLMRRCLHHLRQLRLLCCGLGQWSSTRWRRQLEQAAQPEGWRSHRHAPLSFSSVIASARTAAAMMPHWCEPVRATVCRRDRGAVRAGQWKAVKPAGECRGRHGTGSCCARVKRQPLGQHSCCAGEKTLQ